MKKLSAILIASILTVFAGAVHAQEQDFDFEPEGVAIADNMTCDQAVAYYQQHKRIYKRVWNGDDIVPIYGMTPKAEWRKLVCHGRGKTRQSYYLRTLDVNHCVIAYYCQ